MTRLTLPLQFRTERAAVDLIRTNSLFTIGALAVPVGERLWHIVIDTRRPDVVVKYLGQHMPGVVWARSETP